MEDLGICKLLLTIGYWCLIMCPNCIYAGGPSPPSCPTLQVSSLGLQPDLDGLYTYVQNTNGRPSYKHTVCPYYLYYVDQSPLTYWLFGPENGGPKGHIMHITKASSPEQTNSTWLAYNEGSSVWEVDGTIAVSCNGSAYVTAIPLAYWNLNSQTQTSDSGPNSITLTRSDVTFEQYGARFLSSMKSSLYIDMTPQRLLESTADLSITFWINPGAFVLGGILQWVGTSLVGISELGTSVALLNDNIAVYVGSLTSANEITNTSATVTQDTWNHVAITYTKASSVLFVYINGSLQWTGTLSGLVEGTAMTSFFIGAVFTATDGSPFSLKVMDGLLACIGIYDVVLAEQNIMEIMNLCNSTESVTQAGNTRQAATTQSVTTELMTTYSPENATLPPAVAFWILDQSNQTTDVSGNGFDLLAFSLTYDSQGAIFTGDSAIVVIKVLDAVKNLYLYPHATVAFWLYPQQEGGILQYINPTQQSEVGLSLYSFNTDFGLFTSFITSTSDMLYKATNVITPNEWNHVALVYNGDNDNVDLYINATQVWNWTIPDFSIGTQYLFLFVGVTVINATDSVPLVGRLACMGLYNSSMNAAQVTAQMESFMINTGGAPIPIEESCANPCVPNVCQNGGTCFIIDCDNYRCGCLNGFEGLDCNLCSGTPCSSMPCYNGGTCADNTPSCGLYKCTCPDKYVGDRCGCPADFFYDPTTSECIKSVQTGSQSTGGGQVTCQSLISGAKLVAIQTEQKNNIIAGLMQGLGQSSTYDINAGNLEAVVTEYQPQLIDALLLDITLTYDSGPSFLFTGNSGTTVLIEFANGINVPQERRAHLEIKNGDVKAVDLAPLYVTTIKTDGKPYMFWVSWARGSFRVGQGNVVGANLLLREQDIWHQYDSGYLNKLVAFTKLKTPALFKISTGMCSTGFWTSGQQIITGTYVWTSTSQAVTYSNWYPGQPSASETNKCLAVAGVSAGWFMDKCQELKCIICEIPAGNMIATIQASTSPPPTPMTTSQPACNDACAVSPCVNGVCEKSGCGTYFCTCNAFSTGVNCDSCISGCDSSPCVIGTCQQTSCDNINCNCPAGHKGIFCECNLNGFTYDNGNCMKIIATNTEIIEEASSVCNGNNKYTHLVSIENQEKNSILSNMIASMEQYTVYENRSNDFTNGFIITNYPLQQLQKVFVQISLNHYNEPQVILGGDTVQVTVTLVLKKGAVGNTGTEYVSKILLENKVTNGISTAQSGPLPEQAIDINGNFYTFWITWMDGIFKVGYDDVSRDTLVALIDPNYDSASIYLEYLAFKTAKNGDTSVKIASHLCFNGYWTSGRYLPWESNHYWLTSNEQLRYTNWAAYQPDNSYTRYCVYMQSDGRWAMQNCHLQKCFICETMPNAVNRKVQVHLKKKDEEEEIN